MIDVDRGRWDKTFEINLSAPMFWTQRVWRSWMKEHGGSVINVSSVGGLKASTVIGAYAISKAADLQLVRNLAAEYGPKNVRVNAIAPGLVRTDFARALWENPATLKAVTATTPLRRIGEPEELGGIAVFLASKAGTYITGQALVVDGGGSIA